MERIEWAGVIGVGALVVILLSGVWFAQWGAAILIIAGARPFYRAVRRNARIKALRFALQQTEDPEE